MSEIYQYIGEHYGVLPVYAIIVAIAGFSATSFKHLFFVLSIACGVYITMFKTFNLKGKFGMFDLTQYIPISQDFGNMITAVVYVVAIGLAAYGIKRVFVAQRA